MTWSLPSDRQARLALALDYPYAAPDRSYLLAGGEVLPLPRQASDDLYAGRHAVLAHGSNRAPAHLLRKFGSKAQIPVTYGWLSGYDVVYGAHVARYAAVTATLAAARGCRVRVALNWLSGEDLAAMHESERMNYSYGRLPAEVFAAEEGPNPQELTLYAGNHGALLLDGAAVAIEAVTAVDRPHRAMSQRRLQEDLASRFAPHLPLEESLLQRIEDAEVRRAFAARLQGSGLESLTGFQSLHRLDGNFA
ncbi:MAG: hypothetical protein Kilf2KO_32170 [Rhodospirillales bacterium]